ncbi:unnamed protein product, partial [Mesorhabditis belari]|uniref:Uncharacterized protein n=1 Tax=Mesorhabditis belari TaxID=2138241 RepID=A0AAF3F344_9BILA
MVPERYNGSTTVRVLLTERFMDGASNVRQELVSDSHHEALFYADRNLTVYALLNVVYDVEKLDGRHRESFLSRHGQELAMLFDSYEIAYQDRSFLKPEVEWGKAFAEKLSQIIADFVYTKKLGNHPPFTRSHRSFIRVSNRTIQYRTYDHEAYYFWHQLLPTISRFNLHLPKDRQTNDTSPKLFDFTDPFERYVFDS